MATTEQELLLRKNLPREAIDYLCELSNEDFDDIVNYCTEYGEYNLNSAVITTFHCSLLKAMRGG